MDGDCSGRSRAATHQNGSHSRPNPANSRNTTRQFQIARIAEASGNARMEPAYPPLQQNPVAREYSCFGNQRTRMLFIAGKTPLSPSPIRMRTATSAGRLVGTGVSAVNKLHQRMLKANIRRGPNRS